MTKQKTTLSAWIFTISMIVLFGGPKLNFAQQQIDYISLGKTVEFNSKILNEKRDILIYTPAGYEDSDMNLSNTLHNRWRREFFYSNCHSKFSFPQRANTANDS